MDFNEVFSIYGKLKEALLVKKEALIKKNLENLNKADDETVVLCGKIAKFDIEKIKNNFTDEQKQELKKLACEIKKIQENNEILIKHSLSVINDILSGILNIAQSENNSYDSQGKSLINKESLDISSITEEA